eukprot:1176522-Prorocentrum_minimum.AAC.2
MLGRVSRRTYRVDFGRTPTAGPTLRFAAVRVDRLCKQMAAAAPPPFKISAKTAAEEGERIHKIRITLSSRNVANLEKGESHLAATIKQ